MEDALVAARAGADAIGLIFQAGAARALSIDQAREIVAALPPFVSAVGLFVNAPAEEIISTARRVGVRVIQLHGEETPSDVDALSDFVVLKSIRVERATFVEELARWREALMAPAMAHLKGLVLESPKSALGGSLAGGTGMPNDWKTVEQASADGMFEGLPPIMAAGGLTPASVGDVVRALRPYGVDVSSGVEIIRREKDSAMIESFVRAVREADQAQAG